MASKYVLTIQQIAQPRARKGERAEPVTHVMFTAAIPEKRVSTIIALATQVEEKGTNGDSRANIRSDTP